MNVSLFMIALDCLTKGNQPAGGLFRDGHAFPSVSEYNYIGFGSESETLTVKRQPVRTGHRHYKFEPTMNA